MVICNCFNNETRQLNPVLRFNFSKVFIQNVLLVLHLYDSFFPLKLLKNTFSFKHISSNITEEKRQKRMNILTSIINELITHFKIIVLSINGLIIIYVHM